MTRSTPSRPFSADPKKAREERLVETNRLVAVGLERSTTSRPMAAAVIGVSDTELGRTTSISSGRHFPLADVSALPGDAAHHVLSAIAGHFGWALVELPTALEGASELRALAAVQRESADVVARGLEAMADGHITRAEGAELEREAEQAIAALLAIRELGRLAVREGVVGLTVLRSAGGAER